MIERVSDKNIRDCIGEAEKRLFYYANVPQGWRCEDNYLWSIVKNICYELQQRRSQQCETCTYAGEWDDMLTSDYRWCNPFGLRSHKKPYCSEWQAKDGNDG